MRWYRDFTAKFPAVRYQMRVLFFGPLLVSFAAMYFLASVPQAREVYLGLIEDRQVGKALLGVALICLLCALLAAWQHMLGTAAIDRMYPDHADRYIDRRLISMRNWLARTTAFLPLFGLFLGLSGLVINSTAAGVKFANAHEAFRGTGSAGEIKALSDTISALQLLPLYLTLGLVIVGVLYLAIAKYVRRVRRWDTYPPRQVVIGVGAVLSIATVVVPLLAPDYVVGAAQAAGPLAGAALVLITLVSLLMLISHASRRLRWPIMGTFFFVLLVWMGFQAYLSLTQTALPPDEGGANLAAHRPAKIGTWYDTWLAARMGADGDGRAFQERAVPYPVFIISAQGGGIYAAAAASAFLASMQDRCPNFAQHVFAISGVSGGAVGSTLFSALEAKTTKLQSTLGCSEAPVETTPGSISEQARKIVRGDHLSPALALLWPDVARKLTFTSTPAFDRSSVLERSFACAYDAAGKASGSFLCKEAFEPGADNLRMPFEAHWDPVRPAPALVLSATWVETGFRAAFAPFPLNAASDGTLYSFHRSQDGKGDFEFHGVEFIPWSRSLVQAALVSARFPGIVPAWPLRAKVPGTVKARRWNFVDGGYVDNSGASTALEIYKALEAHETQFNVKLYLVMLTDANTAPDFSEVEDGTRFDDIVAPVTALLSVRGQLAGRAVKRAIDGIEPKATAEELAGRSGELKVLAVNLKQKTFNLPLGWKISSITDDIVRFMLGRPEFCETNIDKSKDDVVRVIRDNSCVKRRIAQLLSGGTAAPRAAAPVGRGVPAAVRIQRGTEK